MKKKNIGSSFDSWLREEGIFEEVSAEEKGLSKAEMARRMHTSRAALNRLLDPENDSVTLNTLQRAATVIGREVRLVLV